jgi:glutamyl-Q tRNA(Asp) synthetase
MTRRGRFAPSPTGPLHFGSLVAAVASWVDARAAGGEWLVRIEDVDAPRTVPGAADEILRALEAFGLEWDGEVAWQSRRTPHYQRAFERLEAMGVVYRCRCSRRELADSGLPGIEGAVYPGTCRALGLPASQGGADRVRVGNQPISFVDRVQGPVSQRLDAEIGDFVLRRRDGLFAYQLAVVVDDADQRITDVVRGADLLLSTPRQIHLQELLGYPAPAYLHVPVATHHGGQKLSKQSLAPALDAGRPGPWLAAALEFLGQPAPPEARPAEMLAAASAAWDPRKIPGTTALEVTNSHQGGKHGGI